MLQAASRGAVPITRPHGLDQIISTFGNIFAYVLPDYGLDPHWEMEQLVTAALPFSIPLSWDRTRPVNRIRCHRLIQTMLVNCFEQISAADLRQEVTSFGGCYAFRPKRMGTKLSAHSWGIAIDLNPETNQQGTAGNMSPGIVSIFCSAGFIWGGDWEGIARDPMHFQFCSGY